MGGNFLYGGVCSDIMLKSYCRSIAASIRFVAVQISFYAAEWTGDILFDECV
jgi:hypothetical protein